MTCILKHVWSVYYGQCGVFMLKVQEWIFQRDGSGSHPPSGPWPDVWYCSPADTEQNKQNRENRRAVQHLISVTHQLSVCFSYSIIHAFIEEFWWRDSKLSWGLPAVCVCSVAPGWPARRETPHVYMKNWFSTLSWSLLSTTLNSLLKWWFISDLTFAASQLAYLYYALKLCAILVMERYIHFIA